MTSDLLTLTYLLSANPHFTCALKVVVQHEINCFFDLPIFTYIVNDKWDKFGYRMHVNRVLANAFFVAITTFALDHRARSLRRTLFHTNADWDETDGMIHCFMFFECPASSELPIQITFDVCLYILGIPYLLIQVARNRRFKMTDLDPNGDLDWSLNEIFFFLYKNLTSMIGALIVGFLIGAIVDRCRNGTDNFFRSDPVEGAAEGDHFTELRCLSLVTLFMYCNLLHLLLPFESIGPVLITIWRMLMGDVTKWIVIYFFLLMGFSQAVIIGVQDVVMKHPEIESDLKLGTTGLQISTATLNTMDCVKYYLFVTLGDVSQPIVWVAGRYTTYIWILHVIFLVLSTLLLLNLIIAMMGETYAREKTNEGAAMWWMMKAARVLDYETQLSYAQRAHLRTGIDPFTAGREKETLPYYRVEVTEAEEDEDVAVGRATKCRTFEDLHKVINQRFERVDARQRRFMDEQIDYFECLEDRHSKTSKKVDLLLEKFNIPVPMSLDVENMDHPNSGRHESLHSGPVSPHAHHASHHHDHHARRDHSPHHTTHNTQHKPHQGNHNPIAHFMTSSNGIMPHLPMDPPRYIVANTLNSVTRVSTIREAHEEATSAAPALSWFPPREGGGEDLESGGAATPAETPQRPRPCSLKPLPAVSTLTLFTE